jgi:F-type H+-transporting ATPase subunit b
MHFDWPTIALQIVNFAVLMWLLQRFLYEPVLRMIGARKADIEQRHGSAKAAEDMAQAGLAEIEAGRASIAAGREAALKAAAAQAEEAAKARRAGAEREASAMLEAARGALAAEREKSLAEARKSALDLGTDIACRLLADVPAGRDGDAWLQRVEDYLALLPKEEVEALARQLDDHAAVTVVTASPLAGETAGMWRSRLQRLLGDKNTIAFDVNPDLIAGAELHFPGAVLRFSWQSALAAVRAEIDGHGGADRRAR